MMRPAFRFRTRFAAAVALVCLTGSPVASARDEVGENSVGSAPLPHLRRIYVPADRPDAWPKGEWQPIPLSSLTSRLNEIRAARSRPQPFLEHAEYSARFSEGKLHEGRLEWSIRRPDGPVQMLPLGEFNLNVAGLTWAASTVDGIRKPVVWGTNPRSAASLLVDRLQGRVDGQWSLDGRILAAATEFDFVLAPATTTRLRIVVPAGMVVSTSQGEAPRPVAGPDPGWTEWHVWLGSRTHARLRFEPAADPAAARPLNVARTNVSYIVRSEAVRMFAEFDLEVLESSLREVRLLIDPDVQVTSIEYGDGGVVSWQLQTGDQGTSVVVQLPDSLAGDRHSLQIQAISQIKQFGAWTLPRLRLENFLESDSKVTLRLQSSVNAADIRSDGYRQLSLTTGAEGEAMKFRQLRPGAAITIVPAEARSDQACRAVSLIQPDRTQWTLTSQLEWSASAGGTYSAACRIPQLWDIVDVRSAFDQTTGGELTGWDVQDAEGGQRVLHVHFRNALNADRPQRLRVTARRLPPAAGEPIVVPPLVPVDATDVEHFSIVSTGPESRPVLQAGSTLEQVSVRNLPADIRSLDFLAPRLADRRGRNLAVRTLGPNAAPGIRIETAPADTVTRVAGNGGDGASKSAAIPAHNRNSGFTSGFVPATLGVTTRISGSSPGFDEYQARLQVAEWDAAHPIRFSLAPPAELVAASSGGRPLFAEFHEGACTLARPADSEGVQDRGATVEIDYRVPAALHAGPNSRRLILPVPEGAVVRCDLSLVIPDHLRLAEQPASWRFADWEQQHSWQRRLLGPFARAAGEPLFNPFDRASWNHVTGPVHRDPSVRDNGRVFRAVAAAVPDEDRIVLWQGDEVAWMAVAALAIASLATILIRLYGWRWGRAAGACAAAGLCLAAGVLTPVNAELAAAALTGLALSSLLPQKFLELARQADVPADEIPTGSTQSFVPTAISVLAILASSAAPGLHAQEARPPRGSGDGKTAGPPVFDVLIPVDASGRPAGESPVAYIGRELADSLAEAAAHDGLPPWLIGTATFNGRLDSANQLTIDAAITVHVLADAPLVRVLLPLGNVNLGGHDACLVDGKPYPLVVSGDGHGLVLELPGRPPAPAVPEPPREDGALEPPAPPGESVISAAPRIQTSRVNLQLQPPAETGRDNFSTAFIAIPSGNQTQASLTSAAGLTMLGVLSGDPTRHAGPSLVARGSRGVLRPSPARQLVFFWSPARGAVQAPAAEIEADVSCLADMSATLVQLRYHVAYRIRSGQVDSLVWHVPDGHVLEAVQSPQLSAYRLRAHPGGGRDLLIEFSRPQTEDFSLTATFVCETDRSTDSIQLPLVDPLRLEDPAQKKTSLRLHQFALREPPDMRVGVASAEAQKSVKPRSVDQFLKEWNAAGARPQYACDLDRVFALNLTPEKKATAPAVRGSSTGRFRAGRLDWVYTAEIEPSATPQFIYRLHADPRLRVRGVSVQEDGAERLLRWSQSRDVVVLFLNDRATRTQTVRIESSLPLAAVQEIELPQVRFVGAIPGPERMTLYRDADVAVRLTNPEDFPLSAGPADADRLGEQLVARLDALPEQAIPRVVVERVLPKASAEVAFVLTRNVEGWHAAAGVAFQVTSGRMTEFVVDAPAELTAGMDVRSIPPSRSTLLPEIDGRVKVLLHPDEPVSGRLIAILTPRSDLSTELWTLPQIRAEASEIVGTTLVLRGGALEPVDPSLKPDEAHHLDWLDEIAPFKSAETSQVYHWNAAVPNAEFRRTRASTESAVTSARLDVWLDRDGSMRGWLGLKASESWPHEIELAWPQACHATSLWVGDGFVPLVTTGDVPGRMKIPVRGDSTNRLVWISWVAESTIRPLLSEAYEPQIPWPVGVKIDRTVVALHAGPRYAFEVSTQQGAPSSTPAEGLIPEPVAASAADGRPGTGDSVTATPQSPATGLPLDWGHFVRIVNIRLRQWLLSLGLALGLSLACWKGHGIRGWIVHHDTVAWLTLAALWWVWLNPGWFALVLALVGVVRALPVREPPQPVQWQQAR